MVPTAMTRGAARWVVACACALVPGAPLRAQETVSITAEPGTVVRWVAPGTERCESGQRSWLPHGDDCYFPVDLNRTASMPISRLRDGERDRAVVVIGSYPYPVEEVTVDDSFVNLSSEDIERSRRERRRIDALWLRDRERLFEIPLLPPLASSPDARNFGSRRMFNGEPRSSHTGADYSATPGTPVLAVADALVALAEEHFFGGKTVYLDHGDGLISMSMHLSEILVANGDRVSAGQVIGEVGSTGRVSGPHLHFGLRWRGARIDPSVLIGSAP